MARTTARHATTLTGSKRGWHSTAAAASVAAAATLSLAVAPSASANGASPCVGQTFTTSGTCTVAAGETVAFTIQGGPGGDGGSGYATPPKPGGLGGIGAKVSGTYINTTGSIVTVTVAVGAPGRAGAAGTSGSTTGADGTDGGTSFLNINSAMFVAVSGGKGGKGGTSSTAGTNGANGTMGDPASLPPGWTLYSPPPGGPGKVVFSVPTAPSTDAASAGPADLVQQVEVPASGVCADVKDADLKWGTTLTGGWHKVWGEWANRFVCSRTFHYGANGWEITPA